jgi:hypothetical protein
MKLVTTRNAVLLALAWAVAWAPIAVVIGLTIIDPDNSMDEMWVAIGAFPGFLSALLFSALVALAGGRRRLAELSLSRAAALGAIAGLVIGALPFAIGSAETETPLLLLATGVIGSITLLATLSALASVLLARTTAVAS